MRLNLTLILEITFVGHYDDGEVIFIFDLAE